MQLSLLCTGHKGGLERRNGESSIYPRNLDKSSQRFILQLIVSGFERGHPSSINRPTGRQDLYSNTINKPQSIGGSSSWVAIGLSWKCLSYGPALADWWKVAEQVSQSKTKEVMNPQILLHCLMVSLHHCTPPPVV